MPPAPVRTLGSTSSIAVLLGIVTAASFGIAIAAPPDEPGDGRGNGPDDGPGGVPIDAPGDALGDARLFFTADERRLGDGTVASAGSSGRDPVERGSVDPAPSGAGGTGSVDGIGTASGETSITARTTPSSPSSGEGEVGSGRFGFEALVRIGTRVRAIVGGRSCRGSLEETELLCPRLPEGVRSLALSVDGRALLVTLRDGRRRRMSVGETLEP